MTQAAERLTMRADDVTIRPATEAELAFGKVTKFDPSQPRDEAGRWTGAGLHEADPHTAARDWSGGHPDVYAGTVRAALATAAKLNSPVQVQAPGEFGPAIRTATISTRTWANARALAQAIDKAPELYYHLYRGISINNTADAARYAAAKPGDRLDFNISSWTRSEEIAKEFARGDYNTSWSGGRKVVFDIEPFARAFDATNDIRQGPEFTEHLTDGRFEVTGVDHPSATMDIVHLKQEATFSAPEQFVGTKGATAPKHLPWSEAAFLPWLEPYMEHRMVRPGPAQKFDPSQPRDEQGRWTDGGAADAAPPLVDLGDHSSYRQADGTLTRWPSLKVAKAEYLAAHPETVIAFGSNQVKPIEGMALLDQLDQLQNRFPQIQLNAIQLLPDGRMVGTASGRALASMRDDNPGSSMSLNGKYWGVLSKFSLYMPSSGFHPEGTDTPSGTATHEFGHAVEQYLGHNTRGPGDAYYDNWILGGDDGQGGQASGADLSAGISGYAGTGSGEAFAEAFAAAYTPGAAGTPASDTMRFWIDEALPPPK